MCHFGFKGLYWKCAKVMEMFTVQTVFISWVVVYREHFEMLATMLIYLSNSNLHSVNL